MEEDQKRFQSQWINTSTAAKHLSVSPQTLIDWRREGHIGPPYTTAGRLIRYRIADLDAWLESRMQKGA